MRNAYREEIRTINAVNSVNRAVHLVTAIFITVSLIYMWYLNFKDGMHWFLFAITIFASIRIAAHFRKANLLRLVDTYLAFLIPQLIVVFALLFWAV